MSNTISGKNLLRPTGLQCKNLQEYLKSRPSEVLNKLYHNPPICLAVFRELPVIAKHYVMRLLFVEHQFLKQSLLLGVPSFILKNIKK